MEDPAYTHMLNWSNENNITLTFDDFILYFKKIFDKMEPEEYKTIKTDDAAALTSNEELIPDEDDGFDEVDFEADLKLSLAKHAFIRLKLKKEENKEIIKRIDKRWTDRRDFYNQMSQDIHMMQNLHKKLEKDINELEEQYIKSYL